MRTSALIDLLLKIEHDELLDLARRWSVGSRRSREELAESLASRMQEKQAMSDQVATLRTSERRALLDLLEGQDAPPSLAKTEDTTIQLADSPAGALGLLFEEFSNDGETTAFVPTDVAALVSERLDAVPAAPKEVTRRRRRSSTGNRPAAKKTSSPSESLSSGPDFDIVSQREIARDIARSVTIAPASAMVELSSAREARIAQNDRELGAAVLDVLEETLVILRASVDPAEWVQRLAVRLEDDRA